MNLRHFNILVVLLVFVGAGASCPRSRQLVNDPAPAIITTDATLQDVIRAVNGNSARIHQVQSQGATLTVAGMPTLEATYAIDRPRRFRLRAETGLLGPVLDLGSNELVYWVWLKQSEQPGVYWGHHDEFESSAARDVLPVPPDWLIEALGVVHLDPTGQHDGPRQVRPGQLEIRTQIPTPRGIVTKVTVVDDQRGWVLEQHLYDDQQQPLATALAGGFQYDPLTGTSLPRRVQIQIPAAQMDFVLETERHVINQLTGDPNQLWNVPQMIDQPLVNLSDPRISNVHANAWLMAGRPRMVARRQQPVVRDTAARRSRWPFNGLR